MGSDNSKPLHRRKPLRVFKSKFLDFSLGFFGLLLAAASAYFPWHVYTHSSEFGPPVLAFEDRASDDQLIDQQATASMQTPLWNRLPNNIDNMTTGSVRPIEDFSLAPTRRPQIQFSLQRGLFASCFVCVRRDIGRRRFGFRALDPDIYAVNLLIVE